MFYTPESTNQMLQLKQQQQPKNESLLQWHTVILAATPQVCAQREDSPQWAVCHVWGIWYFGGYISSCITGSFFILYQTYPNLNLNQLV